MDVLYSAGIGLLINIPVAVIALKRKSVTTGGFIAGLVVGIGIFIFSGWQGWAYLVAFFVSSTFLSRYKKKVKASSTVIHQKDDRRDQWQVLANCATGFLCALLYCMTGNGLFMVTLAASFAASNADTWASELGILSEKEPRSILTFEVLPRGTSGAVSAFGFAASITGAMSIAVVYILFNAAAKAPAELFFCFFIVTAAGFTGSLIDSLLGATVQAQYLCTEKGTITERPHSSGVENPLERGLRVINNDMVNFLSITFAVLLLYASFLLL